MNLVALDLLLKAANESESKLKKTSNEKLIKFYSDVYDNTADIIETLNSLIINNDD